MKKKQKIKHASKKLETPKAISFKNNFIGWLKYWWRDFIGALKNLGQQSPGALITILSACLMCVFISISLTSSLFTPIQALRELEQTEGLLINIHTPKGRGDSLFILQTDMGQRIFSRGRVMKNRKPHFDKALGKHVTIWSQHDPLSNFFYPNFLWQLSYNNELILDYSFAYRRQHSFRRFSFWAIPILLFISIYMPVRVWVNYRK